MTDWIRSYKSTISPDGLGPLQLAWLGDAVWEMHQRLRFCEKPARSKNLHLSVVALVKAEAQAAALGILETYLTDVEKGFVKILVN